MARAAAASGASAACLVAAVWLLKLRRALHVRRLAAVCPPQRVYQQLVVYEFPFLWRKALELALFRTYAIPTISSLLRRTREFELRCSKRYDDTDLLLEEILGFPLGSERSNRALQRLNQIHGLYNISNRDFLYVLTTFVVVPVRVIDAFGWRRLTRAEREAVAATYVQLGVGMGIRDVSATFRTYDDIQRYHDAYEQQYMRYTDSNRDISEYTTRLFLSIYPPALHGGIRLALAALQDDRLRAANGTPAPPALVAALVHGALRLRSWLMWALWPPNYRPSGSRVPGVEGYLALPKPAASAAAATGDIDSTAPRHCPVAVPSGPVKCKYAVYEDVYPDGYRLEQLGPAHCPPLPPLAAAVAPAAAAAASSVAAPLGQDSDAS